MLCITLSLSLFLGLGEATKFMNSVKLLLSCQLLAKRITQVSGLPLTATTSECSDMTYESIELINQVRRIAFRELSIVN